MPKPPSPAPPAPSSSFAFAGTRPALRVTEGDQLVVTTCSALTGQSVAFTAIVAEDSGVLQPVNWTVLCAAGRTLHSESFQLPAGYLVNATASPRLPTQRGQTWVQASLQRNAGYSVLLISDYADSFFVPSWPWSITRNSLDGRGSLNSFFSGGQAAGQNIALNVPPNSYQLPMCFSFILQTSADEGNRNVVLRITDPGGNLIFADWVEKVQVAGTSLNYGWYRLLGHSGDDANRPLPDLRLGPGWSLRTNIAGLKPGDQCLSVSYQYEELLGPTNEPQSLGAASQPPGD